MGRVELVVLGGEVVGWFSRFLFGEDGWALHCRCRYEKAVMCGDWASGLELLLIIWDDFPFLIWPLGLWERDASKMATSSVIHASRASANACSNACCYYDTERT